MRIVILLNIVFFVSFAIVFNSMAADKKGTGKLIVRFVGLSSENGTVKFALCNSAENYKDDKNPFVGKSLQIENNNAIVEFDDLSEGEYAIKAFHDEDDDDDFDTNFLGIPTEDYGFSNNARGTFGPPSWDDAKFIFNGTDKVIEIQLK